MKKISYLLIMLLLLTGCGSKEIEASRRDNDYVYYEDTQDGLENTNIDEINPNINRKVIYSGELQLSTEKPIELYEEVTKSLNKYEGYIESESITEYNVELKVRIKSTMLKTFINEIKEGSGNVNYYQLNSEDITQTYSTYDSRRIALETEHLRVISLIENAKDIKTLLELEKFRADIESELIQINSKINNYDSLLDYSTVSIFIDKEYTNTVNKITYGNRIENTFLNSIDSLVKLAKTLLLVFVALIPYLFIIIPVGVSVYYIQKKINKKIYNRNKK